MTDDAAQPAEEPPPTPQSLRGAGLPGMTHVDRTRSISSFTDGDRLDAAIALVDALFEYRVRNSNSPTEPTEMVGDIEGLLMVLKTGGHNRGMLALARLALEAADHAALRIGSTAEREWGAIARMARSRMNREERERGVYDTPAPGDRF
jgi:hypothetical protein